MLGSGIEISKLGPEDYDTFIQASVDGFSSTGRAPELLKVLAESAAARSDTILFSASLDGELVGTAAMAMIDVEDIKVVLSAESQRHRCPQSITPGETSGSQRSRMPHRGCYGEGRFHKWKKY
ncbi:hypothetical protein D6C93_08202 [Aureobasidium pullulans]|nr:hypothetical protein D6C93_08202 [Aureobasidium pullulans]